ncbi:MAG: metallophosphoesterase [Pseudomonadota bacterium]
MTTTYAIGDVHGHLEKLRRAHDLIIADRLRHGADDALVVHLGDLVDRGPQSADVLEYVQTLSSNDNRVVTLLGNHDRLLLWWVRDGREDPRLYPGLSYRSDVIGGAATLLSYDVDPTGPRDEVLAEARAKVPKTHLNFIATRPLTLSRGECFFVHAGIRPGVPLSAQATEDLLWIRDEFLYDTRDHGALVVHGHTPVEVEQMHFGNHLDVDTGAAFGGPLTVVAICGREVFRLTDQGRESVRPAATSASKSAPKSTA